MTIDDIIRMAREAGAEPGTEHSAILDSLDMLMSAALHAGVAAEREACAQVCEAERERLFELGRGLQVITADKLATAIRTRGEK